VIERVMFDWEAGTPTGYHPHPPAFYSIADEEGTVDEVYLCNCDWGRGNAERQRARHF
jgi:hypothetical protein